MDDRGDLDILRGLYQDLSSLSRSALPNIERLVVALEATIDAFKNLLDRPTKKDESRQKVISGKSIT